MSKLNYYIQTIEREIDASLTSALQSPVGSFVYVGGWERINMWFYSHRRDLAVRLERTQEKLKESIS